MSLSLSGIGLYVGNEVYHLHVDNCFQRFSEYLDSIKQLLCFQDEAIKVNNAAGKSKSSNRAKIHW